MLLLRPFFILMILFMAGTGKNYSAVKENSCAAGRRKAMEDIKTQKYRLRIPALADGKEFYAEEIFWNYYQVEVTVVPRPFPNLCGTVDEATQVFEKEKKEEDDCYYAVMDSLMRARFGGNVYARVVGGTDSLFAADPDRYSSVCWAANQPKYVGGDSTLQADLHKNIHYPPAAKHDSVTGTVILQLNVDTNGRVLNIAVLRGVRHDLDSAAVAGAEKLGPFSPALRRGKKIASTYGLPVKFVLE